MHSQRTKYKVFGLYVAIALIAYALAGAIFNAIYIPGRRTRGIHLHYEAIPPAALGITLVAFKSVLGCFKSSRRLELMQRILTAFAIISFSFSLYFVARPSGKALATTKECQATFAKLGSFVATISEEGTVGKS